MQVNIGKIINTHGIRGELKVYPTSDQLEERFAPGENVYLTYDKKTLEFEIESVRVHKGVLLVVFKDHHDINLVEKYKGCMLFVEASHEDEEDDYYYFELIGCKVMENDEEIGIVTEIIETQAHEILRVKRDNQTDVLIPYVDEFIEDVNVDEQIITVNLIEGML